MAEQNFQELDYLTPKLHSLHLACVCCVHNKDLPWKLSSSACSGVPRHSDGHPRSHWGQWRTDHMSRCTAQWNMWRVWRGQRAFGYSSEEAGTRFIFNTIMRPLPQNAKPSGQARCQLYTITVDKGKDTKCHLNTELKCWYQSTFDNFSKKYILVI